MADPRLVVPVVDPPAVLALVRRARRTLKARAQARGVVVHRFRSALEASRQHHIG